MKLEELNNLGDEDARTAMARCCGSTLWLDRMIKKRPFSTEEELYAAATDIWFACSRIDWQEAFGHHPKIGDQSNLEDKFAATSQWAGEEQASIASARKETLEKFTLMNQKYEKRFGYIFIVYATGKSAEEMLEIVELRLKNNPYDEIKIAASEQNRITKLRLKKLLS